jgi:hypothetical protein
MLSLQNMEVFINCWKSLGIPRETVFDVDTGFLKNFDSKQDLPHMIEKERKRLKKLSTMSVGDLKACFNFSLLFSFQRRI